METKWYAEVTNKESAHEQGLVIDENTGETIAVTYKPEHAALVAATPKLLFAVELALKELKWLDKNCLIKSRAGGDYIEVEHVRLLEDIVNEIKNA